MSLRGWEVKIHPIERIKNQLGLEISLVFGYNENLDDYISMEEIL